MKKIYFVLFLLSVPVVAFADPATPPAPPATPDISLALALWKSGAFLAAGLVALYLVLSLAVKIDKKHAFYIAATLTGVTMLVDTIANGSTLSASALVAAVTTIIAIIVKGPTAEKQS